MTSDRPALGVDPSEVTGVWGRRLDGRIALEHDVVHLPDRRPSVAALPAAPRGAYMSAPQSQRDAKRHP